MCMYRFNPGQIYASDGVNKKMDENPDFYEFVCECIHRHLMGDWGDLCEEDITENQIALEDEGRILSAYSYRDGTRIWIITEWDRSATTVLFPDEY